MSKGEGIKAEIERLGWGDCTISTVWMSLCQVGLVSPQRTHAGKCTRVFSGFRVLTGRRTSLFVPSTAQGSIRNNKGFH